MYMYILLSDLMMTNMGQYYIFKAGSIMSAGFDSLEQCREWGIQGGFKDFAIIKLIDFIKE